MVHVGVVSWNGFQKCRFLKIFVGIVYVVYSDMNESELYFFINIRANISFSWYIVMHYGQGNSRDKPFDKRPRCLVKLPKPPNETGDCIPLASPTWNARASVIKKRCRANIASNDRNHTPVRYGQMQLARGWNGEFIMSDLAHRPKSQSTNNSINRPERYRHTHTHTFFENDTVQI